MEINDRTVVKGIIHLEMVVDDPEASAEFMHDVFGAVQVEKEFSSLIEQTFDCKCIHMQAGGFTFQLLKPDPNPRQSMEPWWQGYMHGKEGPYIHNITLAVKDAEKVAQKILAYGGTRMGEATATTPDGNGSTKVYMYDASKLCGMCIEFIEAIEPGE
jgi:predicted enzyme related to lactoylglutathione lyase